MSIPEVDSRNRLIAFLQRALTQLNSLIVGNGDSTTNEQTLIKFNTSRGWEFQATGSAGANQHLELKNVKGNNQNFRIVTNGFCTFKNQSGTNTGAINCSTGNAQFDGTLTVDTAGSTIAQEAWNSAVFATNWENYNTSLYQPVQYFKDSMGVVHIRGLAKCSTGTTPGTTIFTLPSGYRPNETEIFAVRSNDAAGVDSCRVDVKSDGTVITSTDFTPASNAWVSLAGITFDTRS